MLEMISENSFVTLAGVFGGVLLGLAARLGRFCTLGAIEDTLYGNNTLRLRLWGLAIGSAMMGTYALAGAGLLPLA